MNDSRPSEPAAPDPASATVTHEQPGARTATFAGGAPADANLPARVGRYSIRRLLGRGGMGAVYLAHDPELDRPVALKVPRLAGPDAEERFLREARAAAPVAHPNVCPVHDAGRADGAPYLVMAYIPGPTLTDVLREHGPLPVGRACEIAAAVARGVAEAHRHGIVHRDLKPGNVLMDARRGGEPVVTDFGLALRAGAPAAPSGSATGLAPAPGADDRLTQTGALMGTPAYMPPEQAKGDLEKVGPAADVYALGAILFELLTGAPPFRGDTVSAVVRRIESEPAPAPSAARPGLPAGLDAVVLRALAKDPADRFPSMDAFAAALAPFSAPPKRRRTAALALAAVALLLLAAGVVFYVQTDNGTVEVRLNDPAADVKVTVDGKEITVADGARVTRLRAGPHALEVTGPDFETQTRVFKVTRGGRTVVEIELKPKEKLATRGPAVAPMPRAVAPDPKRARLAQLLASGKQLVRQNRYLDVGPVADEALALDPQSPGALALRGTFRQAKNDPAGARADADAALRLNPETYQALLLRSFLNTAEGRHDDAIADATAAARLDPDYPVPWTNRAAAYLAKKEYRQAVADATRAAELSGKLETYIPHLLTRGAAHAYLGEYEQAIADYGAAAAKFRLEPRTFIQRSAVYDKTGRKKEADADWEAACKLVGEALPVGLRPVFPDPPKPPERKKLTPDEKADLDGALAAFDRAWGAGDLEACRTAADGACRIDPTSARALVGRALVRLKEGREYKLALGDATEAVRLDPELSSARSARGAARNALGDPAGAIADHTVALTLDPRNPLAWGDRAWAFIRRGEYHQALADVNESLRLQPDAVGHGNRALCWLKLGDDKKALADYETVADLRPTEPKWRMICAALHTRLGNPEGAARDRKRALDAGWNSDAPPPDLPGPPPPAKRDPEF